MHLTASTPAEIDQLLLRELNRRPGGLTAAALADELGCTSERVAAHLRRLERERNARSHQHEKELVWTAH